MKRRRLVAPLVGAMAYIASVFGKADKKAAPTYAFPVACSLTVEKTVEKASRIAN
jgi:hypothetical protein